MVAELDALLREELAQRAGLPLGSAPDAALRELAQAGVGREQIQSAEQLLSLGRKARDAIVRGRGSRIAAGQLAAHERRLDKLLLELDSSAPVGNLGISRAGR
ncbi:MAG: hypothetical protein QM756_30820 [Polyangiaceae bacterium]